MLLTLSTEDAIAFARKEGREDGLEEGWEKGNIEGREASHKEIARNLLAKGSTHEFIQEITGLDMETIKQLTKEKLEM